MVTDVMVLHPLNAFCCIPVTVYVVPPDVTVEGTVKFAGIVPEMQQAQLSSLSSSHNVAFLPSTVNDHRVSFPSVQVLYWADTFPLAINASKANRIVLSFINVIFIG